MQGKETLLYDCIFNNTMVKFCIKEFSMFNKKSSLIFLLFTIFSATLLFSAGYKETTSADDIRVATDALNREVTLTKEPQRILVVGRAAIMPADALYLFPSVYEKEIFLATTDQGLGDFFTLIIDDLESTKRLGQQVSAEEIIALKPDLIITKSSNYESIGRLLEPFGIPLFIMDLETSDAWKSEIVELGKLLNDQETALDVIKKFDEREKKVTEKISTLSESDKPTVLMTQVASSDGTNSFSVPPKGWIQSMLVEKGGGIPVWLDNNVTLSGWSKISFEQIAQWDPDYFFLINYRSKVDPFLKAIYTDAKYLYLKSYRTHKILPVAADYTNYFQSDSRWILALQWLAATLHPNLFEDFDMEKEIRSFYKDFYNITDQEILDTLVAAYNNYITI